MSDRRAVSAGHLAVSSVAANEPWRVAVGGNRVQSMTVEQISQAFAAGQLTVRTPLWPPGTSGWQALGNFEQFQSGAFAAPAPYTQLSQFEEADDDPTRMWTGSADQLPGMEMAPVPPVPSAPPAQRPSARTGPRQVSSRASAPRSLPPPAAAARTVSAAPAPAVQRSASGRPRRSSGLWLVAGLVGLVGLGSAVLAARGNWSIAAPADATVAAALSAPDPARLVPSTASSVAPVAQAEPPKAEAPAVEAAPSAQVTPPAEVNQAQLAKYEDRSASAFVAEAQARAEADATPATPAKKRAAERKSAAVSRREKPETRKVEQKAEPAAVAEPKQDEEASQTKEASKVSSAPPKRAAAAAAARPRSEPKAELTVGSAVNEAAAAALGNAAKLASSCRPRGGPSGDGKARVSYSNDGEVQAVEILTPKFRDTLTGSCVRMVFRRAKIAAFKGEPPTFIKSFKIPDE